MATPTRGVAEEHKQMVANYIATEGHIRSFEERAHIRTTEVVRGFLSTEDGELCIDIYGAETTKKFEGFVNGWKTLADKKTSILYKTFNPEPEREPPMAEAYTFNAKPEWFEQFEIRFEHTESAVEGIKHMLKGVEKQLAVLDEKLVKISNGLRDKAILDKVKFDATVEEKVDEKVEEQRKPAAVEDAPSGLA